MKKIKLVVLITTLVSMAYSGIAQNLLAFEERAYPGENSLSNLAEPRNHNFNGNRTDLTDLSDEEIYQIRSDYCELEYENNILDCQEEYEVCEEPTNFWLNGCRQSYSNCIHKKQNILFMCKIKLDHLI